MTIAFVSAHFI